MALIMLLLTQRLIYAVVIQSWYVMGRSDLENHSNTDVLPRKIHTQATGTPPGFSRNSTRDIEREVAVLFRVSRDA